VASRPLAGKTAKRREDSALLSVGIAEKRRQQPFLQRAMMAA
jgi:hypothetical protein